MFKLLWKLNWLKKPWKCLGLWKTKLTWMIKANLFKCFFQGKILCLSFVTMKINQIVLSKWDFFQSQENWLFQKKKKNFNITFSAYNVQMEIFVSSEPGYNKKLEQIAMATKLTISINANFNQEQIYNLCLEKSNNELFT